MKRIALACLLLAPILRAQEGGKSSTPQSAAPPQAQPEAEPPEEDENLKPKTYAFNPLQATKELTIGNYYFKKGNFKAAASRFSEATKWNPNYAEAYFRLGEAEEKLRDKSAARQAYAKVVELSPDSKDGEAARKKLGAQRARRAPPDQ